MKTKNNMKTPKEEKIEVIQDELKRLSKLEAVALSEGGKLLFNSLMKDAVSVIDTLGYKYNSLSQVEFIALCAELKTKLDLARVMNKSIKNKEQADKDLEAALLED